MVKRSFKIKVNPIFIKWAMESSGWTPKEMAESLKISLDSFISWLEGNGEPTLKQLENFAYNTKRPLASFFLPHLPKEKAKPKDFRLHPTKEGVFERKTLFAIRKARKLQEITKELSNNIYEEPTIKIKRTNLNFSPDILAEELRNKFGLDEEKQKKFRDSYQFFNFLREKLGELNIFTFQISMPLSDARGFALSDDLPRVVAVNSKDIIEARIFTLMHEVGHILLGNTGISIPDFNNENPIERWCNEFASSFLFPKNMARMLFKETKNLTDSSVLSKLSRRYKLSKSMLLYNMVKLKFISFANYHSIVERYKKFAPKIAGGGIPAEKRCLSELGNKFVSLVAENTNRNQITYGDALDYLSLKSKSYNKLINKL